MKKSFLPVQSKSPNNLPIAYGLAALVFLSLWVPFNAHGGRMSPSPGRLPLETDGSLRLSAEDRCPVCAMPVKPHAPFSGAIQLTDGSTYYFCSTGCMIRAWIHPGSYLRVERPQLSRCVAMDYFSGAAIDGLAAIWVAGSDVIGPMGPAFVPLKSDADLEAFQRRHGGRGTFRLAEMDDALWKTLTAKRSAP